jgi:hydroxymethylpyrimidine pyrophosphatase-like HAD family hydrolase
MKYQALAIDYDGTAATEGRVADQTIAALEHAHGLGLRLVMVTGRELTDLFNTFPRPDLFDRIVAENGAVLYDPAPKSIRRLALPPPPALLEVLARQGVPISVGHAIVATVRPHERTVLAAIRDLGLVWHVILNKEAVMALPDGVTKATGLLVALGELRVVPDRTVGIGDAENDPAFLHVCGLKIAVANAIPAVRDIVDVVTTRPDGGGVRELIEGLLHGTFDDIRHSTPEPPTSGHRP